MGLNVAWFAVGGDGEGVEEAGAGGGGEGGGLRAEGWQGEVGQFSDFGGAGGAVGPGDGGLVGGAREVCQGEDGGGEYGGEQGGGAGGDADVGGAARLEGAGIVEVERLELGLVEAAVECEAKGVKGAWYAVGREGDGVVGIGGGGAGEQAGAEAECAVEHGLPGAGLDDGGAEGRQINGGGGFVFADAGGVDGLGGFGDAGDGD